MRVSGKVLIYFGLFPIVVVCFWFLAPAFSLTSCSGMLGPIAMFGKMIVVLAFVIFTVVYQLGRWSDSKNESIHRIIVVLLAFGIAVGSFFISLGYESKVLSSSLLKTNRSFVYNISQINLINETTYYGLYGHVDWSCSFTESYQIKNDTLYLKGDPNERTSGILVNSYLITNKYLIPIYTQESSDYTADTLMIIENSITLQKS